MAAPGHLLCYLVFIPVISLCVCLHRPAAPVVGVLGCMAERLKDKLLHADRLADIVVGPDAYRDLPRLIAAVQVRRNMRRR